MNEVVDEIYENETAEELYERIEREKERLISEGKLKKQKKLPEISKDEIPFEIPKSWKWVRLGEIFNIISAKRVYQSDWKNNGIPFYRAREIAKLSVDGFVENELFISQELYDKLSKLGIPSPGDLMVTAVGTLGKTYVVQKNDKFYYKDASVICLQNYAKLDAKYMRYVMHSEIMKNQIENNSKGTTVATLTIIKMGKYIFPLPPLSEQKRISELIDRLFEKLDEAKEKALSTLNTFELRKAKILHLAIQGKLSKQLDEYKTAEELYENIQIEKEKLILEGKLKKQKKLPEISEDEIPFEIPKSWKWVRIGEIGEIVGGGTPKTNNSEFWINGDIAWITPADMKNVNGKYVSFGERNITEKGLNSSSAKLMPKHSVIYSSRAPIGYVAIAGNSLATNQGFKSIVPYEFEMDNFLYYCLIDRTEDIIMRATGTTFKEISGSEFGNTIIPLPSLEEQKEIVKLLDNIFEKEEKAKKLIESILNKIELIKKSILARAVRGEL